MEHQRAEPLQANRSSGDRRVSSSACATGLLHRTCSCHSIIARPLFLCDCPMQNIRVPVSAAIASVALLVACSDGEPVKCSARSNVYAGDAIVTKANAKDFECVQVITGDLETSFDVDSIESLGQLVQVLGDVSIGASGLQSVHGLE